MLRHGTSAARSSSARICWKSRINSAARPWRATALPVTRHAAGWHHVLGSPGRLRHFWGLCATWLNLVVLRGASWDGTSYCRLYCWRQDARGEVDVESLSRADPG